MDPALAAIKPLWLAKRPRRQSRQQCDAPQHPAIITTYWTGSIAPAICRPEILITQTRICWTSTTNRWRANQYHAHWIAVPPFDRIIRAIPAWYRAIRRATVESSVWSRRQPKCSAWFSLHLWFCGHRSSYWICCQQFAVIVSSASATGCSMWSHGWGTRVQWSIPSSTPFSIKCFGRHSKRFYCVNTARPSGDHRDSIRLVANRRPPNWTNCKVHLICQTRFHRRICYALHQIIYC